MFCMKESILRWNPYCFSLPFTTICCDLFNIFLAVAAVQHNSTMGGRINLILQRGDRGHQLVSRHIVILCTLSFLHLLLLFFAHCHHSLLAVIILCSLSSFFARCHCSLHAVIILGLLSSFLAHCPCSWLVILVLGSLSLFFAQCCCSLLNVIRSLLNIICSLLNVICSLLNVVHSLLNVILAAPSLLFCRSSLLAVIGP